MSLRPSRCWPTTGSKASFNESSLHSEQCRPVRTGTQIEDHANTEIAEFMQQQSSGADRPVAHPQLHVPRRRDRSIPANPIRLRPAFRSARVPPLVGVPPRIMQHHRTGNRPVTDPQLIVARDGIVGLEHSGNGEPRALPIRDVSRYPARLFPRLPKSLRTIVPATVPSLVHNCSSPVVAVVRRRTSGCYWKQSPNRSQNPAAPRLPKVCNSDVPAICAIPSATTRVTSVVADSMPRE